MKRCYIAGAISNDDPAIVTMNLQTIRIKAAELREQGCEVFSPAENGLPFFADWEDHMRVDIRALMDCDTIYMLPGWSKSKGARIEHGIAIELGFAVIYGGTE